MSVQKKTQTSLFAAGVVSYNNMIPTALCKLFHVSSANGNRLTIAARQAKIHHPCTNLNQPALVLFLRIHLAGHRKTVFTFGKIYPGSNGKRFAGIENRLAGELYKTIFVERQGLAALCLTGIN